MRSGATPQTESRPQKKWLCAVWAWSFTMMRWDPAQEKMRIEARLKSRRRIEFIKSRKPENGFGGASVSSNSGSGKKKKTKKSDKESRAKDLSLYPLKVVCELSKWQKVRACGPGMKNFGNTCYLNATMQCMVNILNPFAMSVTYACCAASVPCGILMATHLHRMWPGMTTPKISRDLKRK